MLQGSLIDFYREVAASIRRDLARQKMLLPLENIQELCQAHCRKHRDVRNSLLLPGRRSEKSAEKKLLGGIQKNFPDEGALMADFDFLRQAREYETASCAALAVVTEKNFYGGAPSMLTGVTHLVNLPIIRWDFIVDCYQLMQSVLWGADGIRLPVALLDQYELNCIMEAAAGLKLEVIAEIINQSDWERFEPFSAQAAAVYINETAVNNDGLTDLLLQIPDSTPALINGDRRKTDFRSLPCDGAAFFRGKIPIKD